MEIALELFYTPGYARWEQSAPSTPLTTLTLANDLSKPVVLIGRNRQTIEAMSRILPRPGHPVTIVEIADPLSSKGNSPVRGLSRFALSLWWSYEAGVQIQRESGSGKCPIAVRAFGSRQARELEPEEIYATNVSDLVVRIGGEGFWLRTTARDAPDPLAAQQETRHPEETDAIFDGAQDAITALLSCPDAPGDATHLLEQCTPSCPTPHDQLRRYLCSVMSHCLPQLTWPPEGWYLPKETNDTRLSRNEALLGTRSNPTKDTAVLLRELSQFSTLRFNSDDTPMIVDLAMRYGWFPQSFWRDAAKYVGAKAPVNWGTSPRENVNLSERLEFNGTVLVGGLTRRRQ